MGPRLFPTSLQHRSSSVASVHCISILLLATAMAPLSSATNDATGTPALSTRFSLSRRRLLQTNACNHNGVCEWPQEDRKSCRNDCVPCNNDGICQPNWGENPMNCLGDCPAPVTSLPPPPPAQSSPPPPAQSSPPPPAQSPLPPLVQPPPSSPVQSLPSPGLLSPVKFTPPPPSPQQAVTPPRANATLPPPNTFIPPAANITWPSPNRATPPRDNTTAPPHKITEAPPPAPPPLPPPLPPPSPNSLPGLPAYPPPAKVSPPPPAGKVGPPPYSTNPPPAKLPSDYINFTTDATPPAKFGNFELFGLSYSVGVHLVAIPGTDEFLFMERPSGRHPDKKNSFIAGYYNLVTNNFTNVAMTDQVFCAGHTILSNGNILVVGGHLAKAGKNEGLKSIRIFDRVAKTLTTIAYMRHSRWYPTATLLPDGRVLIMGGTTLPGSGTANNPMYEIWDPANPFTTSELPLSDTFVKVGRNIYYPFNFVLPTGHMFSYIDRYGNIIDPYDATVLSVVPSHTTVSKAVLLQYPYSATAVMLPLTPENNYDCDFVFFGGQFSYGWTTTTAVSTSVRFQIKYDNALGEYSYSNWVQEQMGSPRVMGDSVLLPNGIVIILNGAEVGVAGDSAAGGKSKANEPNMTPIMYNPKAPYNKRYSALTRSAIPRMYHSTAALTVDGTILVTGCDRCNYYTCEQEHSPSPTGLYEYRTEIFYPPFYYNTDRPQITFAQPTITFQGSIEVGYDTFSGTNVTGAVIVAPSSVTHSFNMHQRVVGLKVMSNDGAGNLMLAGPPDANVAQPGYYMLFLLNGMSYSRAAWVLLA